MLKHFTLAMSLGLVSLPVLAEVSITGSMEMNLVVQEEAGNDTQYLDRGLMIEFNGADQLDAGGKLIWKISQKITSGNAAAAGPSPLDQQSWGGREAWVGFKGDWGTFKAGRQFLNSYLVLDWPYGQGGNWNLAENNWYSQAAAGKLTANFLTGASVNYQSPSFSGFSFGVQHSWDVTQTLQHGNKFGDNAITDLSVSFSTGGLGLNAGYLLGQDVAAPGDSSQWYVGATYGFDFGLSLRALYTGYEQDYAAGTQDGYDYIVGATYGFGKSYVKGSYNGSDSDGFAGSRAIAAVEYGYNLSKNTVTYARYHWRNEEAGDLQYFMLGAWTGF